MLYHQYLKSIRNKRGVLAQPSSQKSSRVPAPISWWQEFGYLVHDSISQSLSVSFWQIERLTDCNVEGRSTEHYHILPYIFYPVESHRKNWRFALLGNNYNPAMPFSQLAVMTPCSLWGNSQDSITLKDLYAFPHRLKV